MPALGCVQSRMEGDRFNRHAAPRRPAAADETGAQHQPHNPTAQRRQAPAEFKNSEKFSERLFSISLFSANYLKACLVARPVDTNKTRAT
jgi:hypothetical protein